MALPLSELRDLILNTYARCQREKVCEALAKRELQTLYQQNIDATLERELQDFHLVELVKTAAVRLSAPSSDELAYVASAITLVALVKATREIAQRG